MHAQMAFDCILMSHGKSSVTFCLYFSGDTQQCMSIMAFHKAHTHTQWRWAGLSLPYRWRVTCPFRIHYFGQNVNDLIMNSYCHLQIRILTLKVVMWCVWCVWLLYYCKVSNTLSCLLILCYDSWRGHMAFLKWSNNVSPEDCDIQTFSFVGHFMLHWNIGRFKLH